MPDVMNQLWNDEEPIKDRGIEVPRWIDSEIDGTQVAAIIQGGCASGAYMPAVTYHQALATMGEFGDSIFDYIEEVYGDPSFIFGDDLSNKSWSGMAVHYLSFAVELWASAVLSALEDQEEVA